MSSAAEFLVMFTGAVCCGFLVGDLLVAKGSVFMEKVNEVFCDERSRAIWEGKRARVSSGPTEGPAAVNTPPVNIQASLEDSQEWGQPPAAVCALASETPPTLVPSGSIAPRFGWQDGVMVLAAGAGERLAKQEARHAAIVGFIVSHFEMMRGMSAEQAARTIGIDVRTLQRWRHDQGALEPALRRRPLPFLERLVCLLAPAPVAPALPTSMVLRSSPPQLELRAPHGVLAQLDAWAQLLAPCTVTRNNARMFVRADMPTLRRMRAALMHLERWQTCTPLAEDVDAWIGIGGESP